MLQAYKKVKNFQVEQRNISSFLSKLQNKTFPVILLNLIVLLLKHSCNISQVIYKASKDKKHLRRNIN